MSNTLVIVIDAPTDELRMRLDDFLSVETDGHCDDWKYVAQPSRPIESESIKRHLESRLLIVNSVLDVIEDR